MIAARVVSGSKGASGRGGCVTRGKGRRGRSAGSVIESQVEVQLVVS